MISYKLLSSFRQKWRLKATAVSFGLRRLGTVTFKQARETFATKGADALQIGMNPKHLPQINEPGGNALGLALVPHELPLTVREAATYLGVSVQTVYLWVERKQIPHLRVMGRNIRFLKSDLEPFRATFRQEAGNVRT